MTPNDKQIDLLMRRFATASSGAATTEHLDADEMNSFAEGALPPATRARYVSHLADCDHCRHQVAQLAVTAGAVIRERPVAVQTESRSIWQTLTGMFALPVLRYAAFAAVLVIVAGVAFIALRPRHENSELVAGNQQADQHPSSVLKEPAADTTGNNQPSAPANTTNPGLSATPAIQNPKRDESKVAENVAPPVAAKEAPATLAGTETKTGESQALKSLPAYAPPPPGESQIATQEQRSAAGAVTVQKKAEGADKIGAAERERDTAKDAGRADDRSTGFLNQPVPANRRVADEKQKGGPSRNNDNLAMSRNQNEVRSEPAKPQSATRAGSSTEESSETRSAGGRKFRRQGNSWVDQKFKSSMVLKRISRGSEEFNALDSGLRSIAQQLGGEVIVVWKGQAYLIK